MEKEIYTFKEEIERLIDLAEMKVWLTVREGPRLNCLFKLGTEQFSIAIQIAQNKSFVLLGQNLSEEIKQELNNLFEEYLK